jgi:hypothetical protein
MGVKTANPPCWCWPVLSYQAQEATPKLAQEPKPKNTQHAAHAQTTANPGFLRIPHRQLAARRRASCAVRCALCAVRCALCAGPGSWELGAAAAPSALKAHLTSASGDAIWGAHRHRPNPNYIHDQFGGIFLPPRCPRPPAAAGSSNNAAPLPPGPPRGPLSRTRPGVDLRSRGRSTKFSWLLPAAPAAGPANAAMAVKFL